MLRCTAPFTQRWYAVTVLILLNASVSRQLKSQLQPAQYYATPAISRYFDHIQTFPSVLAAAQTLSPAFSTIVFDFESAPKIERKQEPPKKKEKTPKTVDRPETGEKTAVAPDPKENAGEPPKEKVKKEKKKDATVEDGGKKNKGGAAAAGKVLTEDVGEPVPSMIDLRVGHIIDGMISSDFLPMLTVFH